MKSEAAEGGTWSPSNKNDGNNRNSMGKVPPSYYTQSSGVDGIIGKLGRLEALILSQNSKQKKKKETPQQKMSYPLKTTTIDRIIYPVYTKKGLKYGKPKRPRIDLESQQAAEPIGKLLDGFLILYSCRVKLPHEAIKSKLAS